MQRMRLAMAIGKQSMRKQAHWDLRLGYDFDRTLGSNCVCAVPGKPSTSERIYWRDEPVDREAATMLVRVAKDPAKMLVGACLARQEHVVRAAVDRFPGLCVEFAIGVCIRHRRRDMLPRFRGRGDHAAALYASCHEDLDALGVELGPELLRDAVGHRNDWVVRESGVLDLEDGPREKPRALVFERRDGAYSGELLERILAKVDPKSWDGVFCCHPIPKSAAQRIECTFPDAAFRGAVDRQPELLDWIPREALSRDILRLCPEEAHARGLLALRDIDVREIRNLHRFFSPRSPAFVALLDRCAQSHHGQVLSVLRRNRQDLLLRDRAVLAIDGRMPSALQPPVTEWYAQYLGLPRILDLLLRGMPVDTAQAPHAGIVRTAAAIMRGEQYGQSRYVTALLGSSEWEHVEDRNAIRAMEEGVKASSIEGNPVVVVHPALARSIGPQARPDFSRMMHLVDAKYVRSVMAKSNIIQEISSHHEWLGNFFAGSRDEPARWVLIEHLRLERSAPFVRALRAMARYTTPRELRRLLKAPCLRNEDVCAEALLVVGSGAFRSIGN